MISILIADDDVPLRAALRAALEGHYEVCEAGSAAEALDHLTARRFDLVVSDVSMPGSGIELLRRVRQSSPQTAVIVLTGYDDAEVEAQIHAAGVFRYLRKPVSLQDLRAVLEDAVAPAKAGPRS
jgi:two-component system, NtrC family, response regulator PilR